MKHRNFAANCGNCPYWLRQSHGVGDCRPSPAPISDTVDGIPGRIGDWRQTRPDQWCGQHPDFWLEAPADTPDVSAQMAEGVELITVLEHANGLLADLRERHKRLRAHVDGLAERVRGLSVLGYGVETVRRDDVLAIIEGDASFNQECVFNCSYRKQHSGHDSSHFA